MNKTALIFGAVAVMANAGAQGSVDLIGLRGRISPANETSAVFGGTAQKLELEIKGIDLPNATLHADLFAVAGRLAMPLGKTVDLQSGLDLSATLPSRVEVAIPLPLVKNRADIRIRFSATNPTATTAVSLGEVRFEVFPPGLTAQIAEMLPPLPNGTRRLVVFGAGKRLRPALQTMHVPFEDAGETLPDRFVPEQLYMGDVATHDDQLQAQDRDAGARLALFCDDNSLPPGIFADRAADKVFITITLPLLDNLAEDPRAQLAFSKIVQLLCSPISTN